MSYIPFAIKYRPRSFLEVVGQEHIVKTLMNALSLSKLHHAYLFHGPRGSGKTTLARIFSKALNCIMKDSVEPCCRCRNCIQIQEGTSLDVLEIDGASNRGIDEIRELRERIRSAPASSTYKIYIIDEVHMLTECAFNALLKTLEEPPRHVIFIFATTAAHKIPLTILSRCQRFDLRRIPTQMIVDHLRNVCANEDLLAEESLLAEIATLCDGSLRDALSTLEQLRNFIGENRLTYSALIQLLGISPKEDLSQLILNLYGGKTEALLIFDRLCQNGADLGQLICDLLDTISQMLNKRSTPQMRRWLFDFSDSLIKLEERLRYLPQRARLLWELCLLRYINDEKEEESPLLERFLASCRISQGNIKVYITQLNAFERTYLMEHKEEFESLVVQRFGSYPIEYIEREGDSQSNALDNILEVLGGEVLR